MSFTVAFEVNPSNLRTFHNFQMFAKDNTNDGYLIAIRELMLKAIILDTLINQEQKDGIERKDRKENKEELYD